MKSITEHITYPPAFAPKLIHRSKHARGLAYWHRYGNSKYYIQRFGAIHINLSLRDIPEHIALMPPPISDLLLILGNLRTLAIQNNKSYILTRHETN